MDIKHVTTPEDARRFLELGYEPVECSFGSQSVVGPLTMDHHGSLSHLEGVAVRAYRDHFGALPDGKFVVTGAADADACFCIASLLGVLPKGLEALAAHVNQIDTEPIGINLAGSPEGVTLLLWNAVSSSNQDALAFYAGVDRWRAILGTRPLASLRMAVQGEEVARRLEAQNATVLFSGKNVAVIQSPVWGFDVWYEKHPIVVTLAPKGNITIGVQNKEIAEKLLGPGGLKNIFPQLGSAWGGRESIGGSPRGQEMRSNDAIRVANVIETYLADIEKYKGNEILG